MLQRKEKALGGPEVCDVLRGGLTLLAMSLCDRRRDEMIIDAALLAKRVSKLENTITLRPPRPGSMCFTAAEIWKISPPRDPSFNVPHHFFDQV